MVSVPITHIWIGTAHVTPRPGNDLLEGAAGAFVPIVALAEDMTEFVSMITTLLDSYEFEVVEVEDIQRFEERLSTSSVEDDIRELADGLTPSEPIGMDTFQAYDSE